MVEFEIAQAQTNLKMKLLASPGTGEESKSSPGPIKHTPRIFQVVDTYTDVKDKLHHDPNPLMSLSIY